MLLLGLMPFHLIAQVPRQTQLWVLKKEFGYINEIRINNSSPEITIVTLDENQAGPQTDVVGEQRQITKKVPHLIIAMASPITRIGGSIHQRHKV